MKIRYGLSVMALAALVGGSAPALAQQDNTPTDPTAPSGAGCTGFPGDPISCPRNQQNTTIPEEPSAPDVDTQSGQPEIQGTPDADDQQQLPNGASPDNGASNPTTP